MYAEFIACYEATGQVMWLKKFIPDLRVVDCIHRPLRLYCDNAPAVFYAHNNKSSNATKPIEIKFYAVKHRVQDQTISLKHISTKDMLADPLTKGLPPNVFGEHVTGMGLRESLCILDGPRGDPSEWISVLWLVNLIVIIIKMTHARCIYL
jgi:hypothetical protein